MTHSELVLSRLSRLEQMYSGPIPAPLRRWALSGTPPHVGWRQAWAAHRASLRALDSLCPSTNAPGIWRRQADIRAALRECAKMYAETKREFAR